VQQLHTTDIIRLACNTTLVPSWGCTFGQPVRQASVMACEGSACHPKKERETKEQELSYRKQIARHLRKQFVGSVSVTLKSKLRIT